MFYKELCLIFVSNSIWGVQESTIQEYLGMLDISGN